MTKKQKPAAPAKKTEPQGIAEFLDENDKKSVERFHERREKRRGILFLLFLILMTFAGIALSHLMF